MLSQKYLIQHDGKINKHLEGFTIDQLNRFIKIIYTSNI